MDVITKNSVISRLNARAPAHARCWKISRETRCYNDRCTQFPQAVFREEDVLR